MSAEEQLNKQRALTTALLKQVGEPGLCRGCHATIYWVEHCNGNVAPYNPDGSSHFATCPDANKFRGRNKT